MKRFGDSQFDPSDCLFSLHAGIYRYLIILFFLIYQAAQISKNVLASLGFSSVQIFQIELFADLRLSNTEILCPDTCQLRQDV